MSVKQNIKVKKEDIFLFVVGNSMFDPMEKCIDSTRYEIFDTFIYDNETDKNTIKMKCMLNFVGKLLN